MSVSEPRLLIPNVPSFTCSFKQELESFASLQQATNHQENNFLRPWGERSQALKKKKQHVPNQACYIPTVLSHLQKCLPCRKAPNVRVGTFDMFRRMADKQSIKCTGYFFRSKHLKFVLSENPGHFFLGIFVRHGYLASFHAPCKHASLSFDVRFSTDVVFMNLLCQTSRVWETGFKASYTAARCYM